MSAALPPERVDRRALQRTDAAIAALDRMLATPRDALLRGPFVLDSIAISRGLKPAMQHRLYADVFLRELLDEHRALLADAIERDRATTHARAVAAGDGHG